MQTPSKYLLSSLEAFYNLRPNYEKFIFLRDSKKSKVSLRIFDKYITQYAKTNVIIFPGTSKSLYDSYKQQLTAWKKRMFDPNARDHSSENIKDDNLLQLFSLRLKHGGLIEDTNIGQLNFFRWIIQNNIYSLVIRDLDKIKKYIKDDKKKNDKTIINEFIKEFIDEKKIIGV